MHREIINQLVCDCKGEHDECLRKAFIEAMESLEMLDEDAHKRIEMKLYKMLYGEHINKYIAEDWLAKIENKDGTKGPHWSYEETSQFAMNHDKWDWYVALNMIYATFYNPKFTTQDYVEMTRAWLDENESKKGKMLNYYMYVV